MATGGQGRQAEMRVHTRTGGFTIIDNGIFRDTNLSLKARGLLCTMLSLPPDWDYSVRGLIKIINPVSEDGRTPKPIKGQSRDGVYATLKEIEAAGYLVRERERLESGLMGKTIYHIYDCPQTAATADEGRQGRPAAPAVTDKTKARRSQPHTDYPDMARPDTACPDTDKPTQLNTKGESNTELKSITHSINQTPAVSAPDAADEATRMDFDELCRLSLKPVGRGRYESAYRAYRERIGEGYTHPQVIRAYKRYAERYRERNDTPRFAKQLDAWLTQPDGFAWDAGRPQKRKQVALHAEMKMRMDESEREARLRDECARDDPEFAELRGDYARLMSDLAMRIMRRAVSENERERVLEEGKRITAAMQSRFEAWLASKGTAKLAG